jgi:hypothetical protein
MGQKGKKRIRRKFRYEVRARSLGVRRGACIPGPFEHDSSVFISCAMPCPKGKSKQKRKQNASAPFACCSGIYTHGNKGNEGLTRNASLLSNR